MLVRFFGLLGLPLALSLLPQPAKSWGFPPDPIGWVYYRYAPCAIPYEKKCDLLEVYVDAAGVNVRDNYGWPVLALGNGVPLIPLERQGDFILVAPACPLVYVNAWSVTANVPLAVCR